MVREHWSYNIKFRLNEALLVHQRRKNEIEKDIILESTKVASFAVKLMQAYRQFPKLYLMLFHIINVSILMRTGKL